MKLRGYQEDIFNQLCSATTNDIVQLDTGGGKTPIEAKLAQWADNVIVIAHRNILIEQISEKLATFGVHHNTVSTERTRRLCIDRHRKLGRSYIDRSNNTKLVASMQSILSSVKHGRWNVDASKEWLIIIDEAHHAIPENMWGAIKKILPNSRIIGFTATPARMDGESLHTSKGGLFERLVQASDLGDDSAACLMAMGYLSDFSVYAGGGTETRYEKDPEYAMLMEAIFGAGIYPKEATADRHREGKKLDYDSGELTLVGDPIKHYKALALGKRAIMMCPSIKNAEKFAREFREHKVPAACISSKQSPGEVTRTLRAFAAGDIWVLTNVDMIGEGFDLPDCEALIIATQTKSFPRYRQWCGRVLRPANGKDKAVIIDHTGMVGMMGAPDEPVKWDLLNPPCGPKTTKNIPCTCCGLFYPVKLQHCPECGQENDWLRKSDKFALGTYEFDINIVNRDLLQKAREHLREDLKEKRLSSEIIVKYKYFGTDLIGRTINTLACSFPESLASSGVSIRDINTFTESETAQSRDFWIKHFNAKDAKKMDDKKAMKVYLKWLKSK